ncbi:hypothetical protein KFL_004100070 [Klebsormidium nitens]|uniref:Uncharacterized protein n=1 Tax=Klebsormidium nitens TaxID=105231 RepID=A0A1Y1IFG3_KLENI|nr:hypothetical protein KFL_004100070 [Klebsormidium nitens]|eukprot:GAQ88219.1 hypothetical protein KFL_004100070 [Klebsormidium nitens]
MACKSCHGRALVSQTVVLVLLLLLSDISSVDAKKKSYKGTYMEKGVRLLRDDCELSIQRTGGPCMTSSINKENCILRCMNPECYEQVYGLDSLEEGEVDARRGKDFRMCVRKALKEKGDVL